MWLHESIDEIDLKVNKALIKAKRAIMKNGKEELFIKTTINAAGQEAIVADQLSERIFLKTLVDEGLSGTLYSEESGVKSFGNAREGDPDAIVLLLDPLDGSQNYMKNIPIGCISVAYGMYKDEPSLGDLTHASIMNLYGNELYFAAKGYGAFMNGIRLPSKPTHHSLHFSKRDIHISYYAYGANASRYSFDFQNIYTLRSLGSAAWELAMVAEARNDAFADIRGVLKVHDFAGAKIIIEEVGGEFLFLGMSEKEVKQIPLDKFSQGYSVITSLDKELLDHLLQDFQRHGLLSAK